MNATTTFVHELFESDALYFELAADVEPIEGAMLAWVPGLADLPAGCVIQRVQPHRIHQHAEWIERAEKRVLEVGATMCRIYLGNSDRALEGALAAAGYERRVELAFLGEGPAPPPHPSASFRRACTGKEWVLQMGLHLDGGLGSDGYSSEPARWSALMRAKDATGRKQTYLIEDEGAVHGEVGIIETENLLRLKNLYIAPTSRRKGYGEAAVSFLWNEALRRGKAGMGVFGVEGKSGANLYERCGLRADSYVVEWSREL